MKTSNARAGNFSSKIAKIVMALVFASMIGGISVAPAYGRDDRWREEHREHERHERGWNEHRGSWYTPPRYYSHPRRLYAPPPVDYDPAPYHRSPGFNLFIPFPFR